MGKISKVRQNVRLLADIEPEVKDNYNLLVARYWIVFEDAREFPHLSECTPAESITRAFRSLVKKGDILLDEKTAKARRREAEEYKKFYSKASSD